MSVSASFCQVVGGIRRSVLAVEASGINQSPADGLIEKFGPWIEIAFAQETSMLKNGNFFNITLIPEALKNSIYWLIKKLSWIPRQSLFFMWIVISHTQFSPLGFGYICYIS